jgi:hypothetical protein
MLRAQELRDHVSGPLLSYLTEHAAELLSNSHTSLIVPLILAHASGTAYLYYNNQLLKGDLVTLATNFQF